MRGTLMLKLPFTRLCTGLFLTTLLFVTVLAGDGRPQPNAAPAAPTDAATATFESIVIDFQESPDLDLAQRLQDLAADFGVRAIPNSEFSQADNVYIFPGDSRLLERLERSGFGRYAESIEPNYLYTTTFRRPPNDPDYAKQWNFQAIDAPSVWQQTQGEGVTVAVIDTGVTQVRDLERTELLPGYDFVRDRLDASDDNGHGTHVAGTIAQSTNNRYGVAGIVPRARIMPLKVLSAGGAGTVADIAEAVKFAADNGADAINMSLGGGGPSELFQEAIDYARAKGVVIVAAAGNNGVGRVSYPARYEGVIGVAAIDAEGQKTPYSNYGEEIDLAAPGGWIGGDLGQAGGILQETVGPGGEGSAFRYLQGTSMAAPHVAGAAAALKALGISDPDRIEAILKETARKVDGDPQNYYGAGLLDAGAAVRLAAGPGRDWRGQAVPRAISVVIFAGLTWSWYKFLPNAGYVSGLLLGGVGLLPLRGLTALPGWLSFLASSAIPELGSVFLREGGQLHPLTASILPPFLLVGFLLSVPRANWFAIGATVGTAGFLASNAIGGNAVWGLGAGLIARLFLVLNCLLCLGLAHLALRSVLKKK